MKNKWEKLSLSERMDYYKKYKKVNNKSTFKVILYIVIIALGCIIFTDKEMIKSIETFIKEKVILLVILTIIFIFVVISFKYQKKKNGPKTFQFENKFLAFLSEKGIECDSIDNDIFDNAIVYEDNDFILKSNDLKQFITDNIKDFNNSYSMMKIRKIIGIPLILLILIPIIVVANHSGSLGILFFGFAYMHILLIAFVPLLLICCVFYYSQKKSDYNIRKTFLDEVENAIEIDTYTNSLNKVLFDYYALLYK